MMQAGVYKTNNRSETRAKASRKSVDAEVLASGIQRLRVALLPVMCRDHRPALPESAATSINSFARGT
jgi:hypothetical protein